MNRFSLQQMTRLPRLADLIMPSPSEFYPERLITKVGLYEGVLIDTAEIRVFDHVVAREPPHLEVSRDVAALHEFMNTTRRIMLPCPECEQQRPFELGTFINPSRVQVMRPGMPISPATHGAETLEQELVYSPATGRSGRFSHNAFDGPEVPQYRLACNNLRDFDSTQFDGIDFHEYERLCALACVDGLAKQASVVRRDFCCTLDSRHCGFVEFVIYRAVDDGKEPEALRRWQARRQADSSAVMTKDERKAADAFERLKTCVVMEKVGQYPSMADMQLFDIERYRPILDKDQFRDFRMALGLHASGVGCGSFLYLRRVFEGLVADAESAASKSDGWDADEFRKRDFNKKVEYLEAFGQKVIPDELEAVRNRLYGVLSRGVHASSDQECNELFPALQYAIEELLDHKLARRNRELRLREVQSALGGQ